jgi:beta-lactam-binding protein with PASTA domain
MPSRRTLLIGAGAVAIVIVVSAVAAFLLTRPSVRVPSLVGIPRAEAIRRAEALGLRLTVEGTRYSSAVAKGAVASQDPTAGVTVAQGSQLIVSISAGSDMFALPDVVGMTLNDARTALRAKGLDVQFETAPSDAETGTVTLSSPAAGTKVASGDLIRLTVAATGSAAQFADLSGIAFVVDPAPPAPSAAVDIAFEVGKRLAELLRASGASVTMTREAAGSAAGTTEATRIARAKEASATVLVGLSVSTTGLEGLGVLSMPASRVESSVAAASGPLADAVFASLRVDFATVATLTGTADQVLIGSGMPGVRVRLGSTAVKSAVKSFADPAWADKVARGISRALTGLYGRAS